MELKRSLGTTTTAATATAAAAAAAGEEEKVVKKIGKPVFRQAGGDRWEDKSLGEWPENDYRIFVGDLGMEVNDDMLTKAFAKYPTFQKAKVIKDKSSGKSKGFGFVSLMEPGDYAKVSRQMGANGDMGIWGTEMRMAFSMLLFASKNIVDTGSSVII